MVCAGLRGDHGGEEEEGQHPVRHGGCPAVKWPVLHSSRRGLGRTSMPARQLDNRSRPPVRLLRPGCTRAAPADRAFHRASLDSNPLPPLRSSTARRSATHSATSWRPSSWRWAWSATRWCAAACRRCRRRRCVTGRTRWRGLGGKAVWLPCNAECGGPAGCLLVAALCTP